MYKRIAISVLLSLVKIFKYRFQFLKVAYNCVRFLLK